MVNRLDQKKIVPQKSDGKSRISSLALAAKEGSRGAFDQLAVLFHEKIFRMVYYRTRSQMDAEDLTQEIFMRAFLNLPKLKNLDQFQAWLFKIGVNRVKDYYRKKRVQSIFKALTSKDKSDLSQWEPFDDRENENPEALDYLIKQDFWKQIGLFLDLLSQMEKEVFLLRFMDQLTIREITKVLGKNENTVKTHLYRALGKFKKETKMRQFLASS